MSAAASFAFASAVPRGRGPRVHLTSFSTPQLRRGGACRRPWSAHLNHRAIQTDAGVHVHPDAETSTSEDDLREGVTLELRVAVARPLGASVIATRDGTPAADFLASPAALRAVLSGGPEPPTLVADHPPTWRVKAPGFAGRLFFIGPKVEFFPVNVFRVIFANAPGPSPASSSSSSATDDSATPGHARVANVTMELIRGEIEGTPAGVVRWINGAYRAERTTTVVEVDAEAETVTASVDLKVRVGVPAPFRMVRREKIERAMRDAFEPATEAALGTVCEEVVEAWGAWVGERKGDEPARA